MGLATLTAEGQVSVLKTGREALGLRQGDLCWELEDGSVRVRAVAPLDVTYLQGLEVAWAPRWTGQTERTSLLTLGAALTASLCAYCHGPLVIRKISRDRLRSGAVPASGGGRPGSAKPVRHSRVTVTA